VANCKCRSLFRQLSLRVCAREQLHWRRGNRAGRCELRNRAATCTFLTPLAASAASAAYAARAALVAIATIVTDCFILA
jgi:hypothetical protein